VKSGDIFMFLLKELPDKKTLKKLSKENTDIDPNSAMFILQLLKTASDSMIKIDKFFAAHSLSQGRFLALMVLDQSGAGGLFPFEIADGMGVSRATASGLLKGLESSGHVSSIPSETDGRMKRIQITDNGKQIMETLLPEYYALLSTFTGKQDKKSLKQFSAILVEMSADSSNSE